MIERLPHASIFGEMSSKIIVTGGNGFIGSFLVEKLADTGHNVVVLDKNPCSPHGHRAEFRTCNVFFDSLDEHIEEGDIVVHLACSTIPGTSAENPARDAEENIVGTIRLLDVCRKRNIKKFIFPSSGGAIYGHCDKPHTESDETDPQSFYGVIKLAIEKYLSVYEHQYGMKYATLRISNPYGRKILSNKKFGAVDVFLHHALYNKPITVWGDGENVRDYIHIQDVISFLVSAIEKESIQGTYNVGTGHGTSLNKLVSMIRDITGNNIPVTYLPARGVDVPNNILDITKAIATGWQPTHSLSESLRALTEEVAQRA